jgi:hypothetical protein
VIRSPFHLQVSCFAAHLQSAQHRATLSQQQRVNQSAKQYDTLLHSSLTFLVCLALEPYRTSLLHVLRSHVRPHWLDGTASGARKLDRSHTSAHEGSYEQAGYVLGERYYRERGAEETCKLMMYKSVIRCVVAVANASVEWTVEVRRVGQRHSRRFGVSKTLGRWQVASGKWQVAEVFDRLQHLKLFRTSPSKNILERRCIWQRIVCVHYYVHL